MRGRGDWGLSHLSPKFGFEWTRPRARRRIDTQDLQNLNAQLEKSRDVSVGLAAVEASVRAKVGS